MRSVQWTATQGFGGFWDNILGALANFKPFTGRSPFEQFGSGGSDTLRGAPIPTPPAGFMPWSAFYEFVNLAENFTPSRLRVDKIDSAIRKYRPYGIRNVRNYARWAEVSMRWWFRTDYFKGLIAKANPSELQGFYRNVQNIIAFLKNA